MKKATWMLSESCRNMALAYRTENNVSKTSEGASIIGNFAFFNCCWTMASVSTSWVMVVEDL